MADERTATGNGRPAFRSITPVRAYEGIVAQVEEAIFTGQLRVGQRLPSERDMMAQFGVSRATVREALRVLESNGLIRSRHGDPSGGAEVQGSSSTRVAKALTSFAQLGQIGVAELVEFRMVVEGSAVRLAAELHGEAELAAMESAFEEMRRVAAGPFEKFSDADVAFHMSVADCAGNRLLSACSQFARDMMLKLISDKLRGAGNPEALMQESLNRHGAYLDAIRLRDGDLAEALARKDLFDYYEPYVTDDERSRLRLLLTGGSPDGAGSPDPA
ncbi:FadR/GntR family transcriptional regulator [Nonomuraea lactucae]|uniref:FadR/GntR family transcriptional regulator n=1 Tax=Nonomuraea lactucae TaxID=2249762 RepID=UPI000DE5247C|nr:FadR/GntR family transcriptional regulator [Nonomuraea lactucae]